MKKLLFLLLIPSYTFSMLGEFEKNQQRKREYLNFLHTERKLTKVQNFTDKASDNAFCAGSVCSLVGVIKPCGMYCCKYLCCLALLCRLGNLSISCIKCILNKYYEKHRILFHED